MCNIRRCVSLVIVKVWYKRKLIFCLWFVILLWVFIRLKNDPILDDNTEIRDSIKGLNGDDVPNPRTRPIRILLWKGGERASKSVLSRRKLQECSSSARCIVTLDSSLYNQCEIVLFHPYFLSNEEFPSYRRSNQKWLYFETESPPSAWIHWNASRMAGITHLFNFTATYSTHSDVPIHGGTKVCKIRPDVLKKLRRENVNYAANKTGLVVWFVSHCKTNSLREHYVKELQRYIPVDIVGKCGPGLIKCGGRMKYSNCDQEIINKKYKFYLSFENSFCEEYVTEKLWRILDHQINTIAVVLGGANYSNVLPKGTYINVRDFKSPKHLATFLLDIADNESRFNSIIMRKKSLECTTPALVHHPSRSSNGSLMNTNFACRLCDYAHRTRQQRTEVENIVDFWGFKRRCQHTSQYYLGVWRGYRRLNLTDLRYVEKYLKS